MPNSLARKVVCAGLSCALAFGTCVPVAFADPTADDVSAAAAQLESYGNELSSLQDSLASQSSELEQTEYELGENQTQIDDTTAKLDEAKEELSKIVSDNYKSGTTSLLSILLSSSDFEDLASRVYYMDKVSQNQADKIAEVNDLQNQLNSQRAELESKQQSQQDAVNDMQSQVAEYEQKVAEAQDYYDNLSAEVQAQVAQQEAEAEAAQAVQTIQEAAEATGQSTTSTTTTTQETGNTTQQQTTTSNTTTTSNSNSGSSSSSNSGSSSSSNSSSSSSSSTTTTTTTGGASGGGLSTAYSMIGVPYVWGGTSASGVDCSGLVCYCYGYKRGRTTYQMIASLKASGDWKTDVSQLQVGDLVFPHSGHVGIYIGNNQMIHAPSPGRTVCITTLYGFIGGGTY